MASSALGLAWCCAWWGGLPSCCLQRASSQELGACETQAVRLLQLTASAVQDLMNRLGCGNLYSDGGFPDHDADVRSNYIMNSSIQGADQADVILLIGSNPRLEAPVFNARWAPARGAARLLQWAALGRG